MDREDLSTAIVGARNSLADGAAKREQKPLEIVLNDQGIILSRLSDQLNRLESVLAPVLSEAEPSPSTEPGGPLVGSSGVVQALTTNNQGLEILSDRLKNLTRRLEV